VHPPTRVVFLLAGSTVLSVVLTAFAWSSGAGNSDGLSIPAIAAWAAGCGLGLIFFASFQAGDSARRTDPLYVEPS
jgi:hypothetical protein